MPDLRPAEDRSLAGGLTVVGKRPANSLMPSLLQRSAEAQPGNIAILSPQGNRTYAALRADVNRLAHHHPRRAGLRSPCANRPGS